MLKTDIRRNVLAVACTLVMSATCMLGALAPAQSTGIHAPVSAGRTIG